MIDYIYAGGQAVAISRLAGSVRTLRYLHRDHLGSVDTITDENGDVVERFSYDAFGKRRNTDWTDDPDDVLLEDTQYATTRGYTGHEQLDNVKLIHMNGRVYDPVIARFISPDPFVQFPDATQGFNRYTYVNNNPLSFVDPSGFGLFGGIVSILEAVVGVVLVAVGAITGNPELSAFGFQLVQDAFRREAINLVIEGFSAGLINSNGDIRSDVAIGMPPLTAIQSMVIGVGDTAPVPNDAGGRQARSIGEVIVHGAIAGVANPNPPASRNGPTVLDGPPADSGDGALARAGQVAIIGGSVVGGVIPGIGEILDFAVLSDPNSGTFTRVVAGASLTANVLTAGLLPNFGAAFRTINNAVPDTLARVVPDTPITRSSSTLGRSGADDVFVTGASDIRGLNARQISERLTIPESPTGFRVIEFPAPRTGVASPVNRTNPGFVGRGQTAGGAREFVIPNGRIPANSTTRTVR